MILYKEALSIIAECAQKNKIKEIEKINVQDSVGRVLASDIFSYDDIPNCNNSAMDGFAVFSEDCKNASLDEPVVLTVVDRLGAGDLEKFEKMKRYSRTTCVEIMTGAPIPQNSYDAVIKVEDVKVERDSSGNAKKIEVSRSIKAGENIRYQGTDIKKGQLILKSNTKLLPDNIMVCASLGAVSIPVYRKPRVLIVSTGNEIVDASSQELKPGMVRNSTSSYLISILKKFGAQVCYLGIIQDEPKVYKDKLQKALEEKYDVIISTGAVSMGQYDFVPHACEELGAKIYFHKVAIRPGKPILFASWENKSMYQTVFFGLPGNPVSSAVGFQFFVEPYLRIILGLEPLKTFFARLHSDCKKPKGLRSFYKANLKFLDDACLEVEVHSRQESYIVSALSDTNAWAILPEESDYLVKGSLVEVILKSYGNE